MVFLMLGVVVFNGTVVQAAVIHVTTTEDNVPGSLRAAISRANTNNENNTIYLPAGTYFLSGAAGDDANASGDLDIDTSFNLTIIGAGKTNTDIDGNGIDRVLHILYGTVTITDLTIRKGKLPEVLMRKGNDGGGIHNCGNLTLTRCVIKQNAAGLGGYGGNNSPSNEGGNGGGIYNQGELILNNCTITGNNAGNGGDHFNHEKPGNGGQGGGIWNSGILALDKCVITGNNAGNGGDTNYPGWGSDGGHSGGIYNSNILNIYNCTISSNRAGDAGECDTCDHGYVGNGGGINNGGTLTMSGCTINDNATGSSGYDLMGGGICNWASLTLSNCTISGNWAGSGGGLYNGGNSQLNGVTVVYNDSGGIFNEGLISIKNSIAANNNKNYYEYGSDCVGTFDWVGYSLIEDTSQCTLTGFQKANILGKDPMLGPLQNNGGPTYTHALLPGSPAIDAGKSFDLSVDQRGYPRPVDFPGIANVSDGADIGAYEFTVSYTISGTITYSGIGLPGVMLSFSNKGGSTTTGPDGHYSHSVLHNWSGTATPTKEGYAFTPSSRNYTVLTANQSNQDYIAAALTPPQISLNRSQLYFGADTSGKQTDPQSFLISNSGGGILKWSAAVNADWLSCNPASGTGPALVTVSINPPGLLKGTYTGTITVTDPQAGNSPQIVTVTLTVYGSSPKNLPRGVFDTPISGSTVTGSIPVTGWAIDNIGIETVKIYRDPVTGEGSGLVYIGDAIFVEGARPDVEAAYPGYPNNYKAGWGYLMLTNALPGQGNGTFTLYANATDKEGNTVTLGSKTSKCDNAHAVKPFGALDTPAQGGAASGSNYINFGWALTPLPNTISRDGSTIIVWVDGLPLGHPVYNQYRADIAALFPGYNNSDGAVGYYYLDTTRYKNGVHTISWSVRDDAGNVDGIGSRYFTIQDTGAASLDQESPAVFTVFNDRDSEFEVDVSQIPGDYFQPVQVKKGYNRDIEPQILYPDDSGNITIEIDELEPIEIYLPGAFESLCTERYGYQVRGDRLKALPIGSSFNIQEGVFSWQPGPGFLGVYELVFITRTGSGEIERKQVTIKINPEFIKEGGNNE